MSSSLNYQPWLKAVLRIAKHYRIETSEEQLRLQLNWNQSDSIAETLTLITRQLGMSLRQVPFSQDLLNPWLLPVVVELSDGQVAVIEKADSDGNISIQFSADEGLTQTYTITKLQEHIRFVYIIRPEKSVSDVRVDEYIKPYEASWFWGIVLQDWKRYIDIMFASLMANILALATVVFSMNVYDRVIPAQSIPTLWVLAGGVLIAAIFEFSIRVARVFLSDIIGKRADLKISDRVFGHALRIKNKERSKSTGTFISQIRELEGVRELVTSTTISAIADLPFFLMFLVIFWLIGGNLFWVMLVVVPLMILPGLLIQKPLAKLAKEGMREGAIRNAMLVEVVQGIEDIKLLRAESRFQNQWNRMNEISADISMRQRKLVGVLNAWTQKIQGLTFAVVVLVGCFAVMKGEMTTGALVACSMLSSRMLGPIAQITGVLGRFQQAKVAKTGLDELMKRTVDQPERAHAGGEEVVELGGPLAGHRGQRAAHRRRAAQGRTGHRRAGEQRERVRRQRHVAAQSGAVRHTAAAQPVPQPATHCDDAAHNQNSCCSRNSHLPWPLPARWQSPARRTAGSARQTYPQSVPRPRPARPSRRCRERRRTTGPTDSASRPHPVRSAPRSASWPSVR